MTSSPPMSVPTMGTAGDVESTDLADIAARLAGLRAAMATEEGSRSEAIARVPGTRRDSAVNLVYYLALRGRDERELQSGLTEYGLSSLGRSEAHVAATCPPRLPTCASATRSGSTTGGSAPLSRRHPRARSSS